MCTGFSWGNRKERVYLESMHIDRRILKCILKKKMGGADWIYLA
jgi:hypothetical protein